MSKSRTKPKRDAYNDRFLHLCRSLFTEDSDLFIMLTAYFDDSGNDSVAVVAGYLSSTQMWETFNARWASLLSEYEVTQLHRTDLENFRGQFRQWTPELRTEFVKKAHAVIKRYTYSAFGLSLIKSDFESVIPSNDPENRFGIFGWCAQGCLAGVYSWCVEHKWFEPIQYVFEAGTVGHGQFNSTMEKLYRNLKSREENRIAGWSFQSKDILPLQAADVVAYEYFKFIQSEIIDHGRREVRLSARNLIRSHETQYFRHFNKEDFSSFVEHWKTIGYTHP